MKKLLLILLFCIGTANVNSQTVVYVDIDATGANDGTSWANAYNDPNEAFQNLSTNNVEFWIAEGVYLPDSYATFNAFGIPNAFDNIKVLGGFNGTETNALQRNFRANPTELTGDFSQNDVIGGSSNLRVDNAQTTLFIGSSNTLVEGVTISGGYSGGGSLIINKNGGGVFVSGTALNVTLKNCKITDNYAANGGAGIFHFAEVSTALEIVNTEISFNRANWGAGIYAITFANNISYDVNSYGNLFFGNQTDQFDSSSTVFSGSAMWLRAFNTGSTVNANIFNNVIYGNIDGGSLPADRGRTSVGVEEANGATINVQFSNNITEKNTDGVAFTTPILSEIVDGTNYGNPVITYNLSDAGFSGYAGATVNNNTVINDSNTNPIFSDAANGDFTLVNNSSAIDSGDANLLPSTFTVDFAGNQRVFGANVDQGIYEFGSPVLSIDDVDVFNKEIKLYPNPARSILNIRTNQPNAGIEIYSALGQKVIVSNQDTIDVSQLENGLYFAKIKSENDKIQTLRFIKINL
ncbi:T9SS type A sorting domain-containing protein [Winogradskyella maritima]|uniref:T9SS type A sorting domain-containing protein n=1 Tax=Winogradskyella maritima TaxID=1517766 RepID=A0ABV8AFS6_9FLAO|nr:T9SS type A sorting domain-containing protein [Winogradskyella maritima]